MLSQKKAGVVLSYISQGIHILTNLVYVPVMLRILGRSEYGLYQLAVAVVSNLNILSMGFSSAYIRFYSRKKKEEDKNAISKLNGMFMSIFIIIAMICIFCGVLLVVNARVVLGEKLSCEELEKSKILMLILVMSMAITFITSVFQSQISAEERFIWLKGVDVLSYIVNPVVALPLLLMGYGSIGMVSVTLGITIVTCCLNGWFVLYKLKARFIFRQFEWKLFKEMSGFTFYIFINIIVEQINWSIDKFLLGRMRGTDSVAIYGVGSQIITLYRSISGTIRGVFVPQINGMVANKVKIEVINGLFIKLGRNIYIVAFLICSGFFVFGKEFVLYWAGEGYENAYWIALLEMVFLLVPIIQGPGIDIQRAMNKHKARSIAYTVIAIGNLFISVILIKPYGEVGAAVGTAIALVAGQWIFMNYYYHFKMGLDMCSFWKNIMRYIPYSIVSVIIGILVKKVIYRQTILSLGIAITIYACLYCVTIYILGFDKNERNYYKNIFRRRN